MSRNIKRSGAIGNLSAREAAGTWLVCWPLMLGLLLSVFTHVMLLVLIPGFRPATSFAPVSFTVEIMPSARVESEPPPRPKAPEAASRPKRAPNAIASTSTPSSAARVPMPDAPVALPATEVLTLREESDAKPAAVSRPITPEPRPESVQAAITELAEQAMMVDYGQALSRAIGQYQRYPMLAQQRGWQGTAEVLLRLAPGNNRIVNVSILRSSGYEMLDQQAMEMVKLAEPLPPAPEVLRPKYLSVVVPIVFKLKN